MAAGQGRQAQERKPSEKPGFACRSARPQGGRRVQCSYQRAVYLALHVKRCGVGGSVPIPIKPRTHLHNDYRARPHSNHIHEVGVCQ